MSETKTGLKDLLKKVIEEGKARAQERKSKAQVQNLDLLQESLKSEDLVIKTDAILSLVLTSINTANTNMVELGKLFQNVEVCINGILRRLETVELIAAQLQERALTGEDIN